MRGHLGRHHEREDAGIEGEARPQQAVRGARSFPRPGHQGHSPHQDRHAEQHRTGARPTARTTLQQADERQLPGRERPVAVREPGQEAPHKDQHAGGREELRPGPAGGGDRRCIRPRRRRDGTGSRGGSPSGRRGPRAGGRERQRVERHHSRRRRDVLRPRPTVPVPHPGTARRILVPIGFGQRRRRDADLRRRRHAQRIDLHRARPGGDVRGPGPPIPVAEGVAPERVRIPSGRDHAERSRSRLPVSALDGMQPARAPRQDVAHVSVSPRSKLPPRAKPVKAWFESTGRPSEAAFGTHSGHRDGGFGRPV